VFFQLFREVGMFDIYGISIAILYFILFFIAIILSKPTLRNLHWFDYAKLLLVSFCLLTLVRCIYFSFVSVVDFTKICIPKSVFWFFNNIQHGLALTTYALHLLFWEKLYENSYLLNDSSPLLQKEILATSKLKKIIGLFILILWIVTFAFVIADFAISKLICYEHQDWSIPEIGCSIFFGICFILSFPGTVAFMWYNYWAVYRGRTQVKSQKKSHTFPSGSLGDWGCVVFLSTRRVCIYPSS